MSLKVLEFGPCNVLNLRKQPTFWNATTVFPGKQHLRKEHRNSILMTCHYPDLGSAWSCNIFASTKLFEAKFLHCTTNQKLCPDLGSDTSSFWNFSKLGKPVVLAKVSCFLRASLTFSGEGGGGDERSTRVQFSGGVATCTPVHAYLKNVLNIDKKQKQK